MVGYYHLAHATWPGAWWQVKLETHSLLPRKGVIYAVKGAMTSSCCVGHCSICHLACSSLQPPKHPKIKTSGSKNAGLAKKKHFPWPTRRDPQPQCCRLYTIHNVGHLSCAETFAQNPMHGSVQICPAVPSEKNRLPAKLIATKPRNVFSHLRLRLYILSGMRPRSRWCCGISRGGVWSAGPLLMNRVKPEKFPDWSKTGTSSNPIVCPSLCDTPHHLEFPSTSSIAGLLLLETESPLFFTHHALRPHWARKNCLMLPWGVLSSRSDSPPPVTLAPAPPAAPAPQPPGCARVHWSRCEHWSRAALGGSKPWRWEGLVTPRCTRTVGAKEIISIDIHIYTYIYTYIYIHIHIYILYIIYISKLSVSIFTS